MYVVLRQVPAHLGTGGGQRARREGAALGVRHDQRGVGPGRVVVPPLDQLRHVEQPPVGGAVREEPLGVTRDDVGAVGAPRYSEGRTFPALAGPYASDLSGGVQGDPVTGDEDDGPGLGCGACCTCRTAGGLCGPGFRGAEQGRGKSGGGEQRERRSLT